MGERALDLAVGDVQRAQLVPALGVVAEEAHRGGLAALLQGVEAENRQKLWRWFIAATLAVLLAESALAGWTARRSALRTQEATS